MGTLEQAKSNEKVDEWLGFNFSRELLSHRGVLILDLVGPNHIIDCKFNFIHSNVTNGDQISTPELNIGYRSWCVIAM